MKKAGKEARAPPLPIRPGPTSAGACEGGVVLCGGAPEHLAAVAHRRAEKGGAE